MFEALTWFGHIGLQCSEYDQRGLLTHLIEVIDQHKSLVRPHGIHQALHIKGGGTGQSVKHRLPVKRLQIGQGLWKHRGQFDRLCHSPVEHGHITNHIGLAHTAGPCHIGYTPVILPLVTQPLNRFKM